MIIVTPAKGSYPEPRPQSLVTGDRAITLLDASAATALVSAGVKVVTVTSAVYTEIVNALVPPVSTDIDPATGMIKESVLPTRLSTAAIAALNVLDSVTHTVAEQYIPSRLSTTNVTALIAANSQAQTASDPDGTPVILAAPTAGGTSVTYSGTVTSSVVTAGTTHGDILTGNVATLGTVEVTNALSLDPQVSQPVVSSGIKLYSDGTKRLAWVDTNAQFYRAKSIQTVTTWPTSGMVLGDEAIIASTGEHRIWKGASLGWRQASTHTVADVAGRNAIGSLYPGYRVFVTSSNQFHEYRTDNKWHGTKDFRVQGGSVRFNANVNDTNWRRWNETAIIDPGYDYYITGSLGMEVVQQGTPSRAAVWVSTCDYATGTNWVDYIKSYGDDIPKSPWYHFDIPILIWDAMSGSKTVAVNWRTWGNGSNAYAGGFEAHNDYIIKPA